MVHLLAALLIVSPPRPRPPPIVLKHCLTTCKNGYDDKVQRCWYEEARACRVECVSTRWRQCLPSAVALGGWDPVPPDYSPDSYDFVQYPPDTFVSHLADSPEDETPVYHFNPHLGLLH